MEVSGEVLEETISDIVDTAIDRNTVDPNAEYTLSDWQNTALVTTLSTLTMNAITNGSLKLKQRASKDNTIQTNSESTKKANDASSIAIGDAERIKGENSEQNNQQSVIGENGLNNQEVYQQSAMDNVVLKKGVYNPEVHEFIYGFVQEQLDKYETFKKVYGEEFVSKKLRENIRTVYTDEQRPGFAGYYTPTERKIVICNKENHLTPSGILNDSHIAQATTHESIHAILNHYGEKIMEYMEIQECSIRKEMVFWEE